MKDGLKKILPGLIPLLVFIIADAVWGPQIGVLVALGIGVIELVVVYIKDRVWDKFILFDTLVLVLFSSLSIVTHDALFFKLKPAFMESFLVIILGISIFTPKNLVLMMARRFMPSEVDLDQQLRMKKLMKPLWFIILFHIVLIVYSAFKMSNEWWGFISGILFYVLILGYFASMLLWSKYNVKKQRAQIPFYDAGNNMTLNHGHFVPKFINVRLYLEGENSGNIYLPSDNLDAATFDGNVSGKENIETLIGGWIGVELNMTKLQVNLSKEYFLRDNMDKVVLVLKAVVEDDLILSKSKWQAVASTKLNVIPAFDLK